MAIDKDVLEIVRFAIHRKIQREAAGGNALPLNLPDGFVNKTRVRAALLEYNGIACEVESQTGNAALSKLLDMDQRDLESIVDTALNVL